MKILSRLKRFSNVVSRGRSKGKDQTYLIGIAGDNYCWNICKIPIKADEESMPIGQKFFKGFEHLLEKLHLFDIDFNNAYHQIIQDLENATGKSKENLMIELKNNPDLNCSVLGKKIDDYFECNYLNNEHNSSNVNDKNRIYIRILGNI